MSDFKSRINLVDQLCILLNCNSRNLENILDALHWDDPAQNKIYDYLNSHNLYTLHLKNNRLVYFDGLSLRKAKNLFALNGYLNITIPQYYFLKRRIKLKYPNLPCIAEEGSNFHTSYFPMELLVATPKVI